MGFKNNRLVGMILLVLAVAVLLGPSSPLRAAIQQSQPAPSKQPGQPAKTPDAAPAAPATPPLNKEEEDGFKAIMDAKADDIGPLEQSGEEFLKKFPDSRYREGVYSKLASAYMMAQQADKMYAAAEKALQMNADNVDMLALMAMTMPRGVRSTDLDAEQKLQKAEK